MSGSDGYRASRWLSLTVAGLFALGLLANGFLSFAAEANFCRVGPYGPYEPYGPYDVCPNLVLHKTADPDPVTVGETLTYTIEIRNISDGTATNVVVTDALPPDTTFISADASAGGVCVESANVVTCTFEGLGPGESRTVTIEARVNSPGTITNEATVDSDQGDVNPANNSDTAEVFATGGGGGGGPGPAACNDGADNDSDGLTDFPSDPGCTAATDTDETNASPSPSLTPSPSPSSSPSSPVITDCNDGVDNDDDDLTDFPTDPGCSSPEDIDEFNAPLPECADELDNDSDGLTDFGSDPDCLSAEDDVEGGIDPQCGLPNVICGTPEDDVLTGTPGDDIIIGDGGDDDCNGLEGNDDIFCGTGNDSIRGGKGNDTLRSTSGNDVIGGGGGSDTIKGGSGNDELRGGRGKDTVRGQSGADTLNGGPGVDTLNGGPGRDGCHGGRKDSKAQCE